MKSNAAMCMKCGSTDVFWHENRHGKWVLCRKAEQYYENGVGTWTEPHYCVGEGITVEEMQERYLHIIEMIFEKPVCTEWKDAENVVEYNGQLKSLRKGLGENVPSLPVEVFKGRKVPKGTVGEVIYFGVDSYATIKVGIKDANGEAHFTAITNVRFVETTNA